MDWAAVSAIGAAAGGTAALGTMVFWVVRKVGPGVRAFRAFMRHAMGVPVNASTGQPGIPSIFERLTKQDEVLSKQNEVLAKQNQILDDIRHEVFPNSGNSLRDRVDKTATEVRRLHRRLDGPKRDHRG